MRQGERRRTANRQKRSALRSAIKKVRGATTPEAAREAFANAQKLLDRAARTRLVHPNAAARVTSRLQKLVNKASA